MSEPSAPVPRVAALDHWFRGQGLPTLLPFRRWDDDLPRRVAPFAVYVTVLLTVLVAGLGVVLVAVDELPDLPTSAVVWVTVITLVVGFGLAQLAYLGVRRALRGLSPRAAATAGWSIMAGIVVVSVLLGPWLDPATPWWGNVALSVAPILACLLVAWLGGGAFLAWTARAAVANLAAVGQMASLAVPVILMLVIFAFFSAEMWQLTTYLSWPRLFGFGAAVAGIAMLAVLRVCLTEIETVRVELTPHRRAALVADTPAAALDRPSVTSPVPLTWPQRANMLLLMIVAQLILGGLFAALQAVLLVVLGSLALTDDTIVLWLGEGTAARPLALEPLVIGSVDLPISINLIKASAFLGMVSALTFVISAVSEPRYREQFFDPIMDELRRAIAVHDVVAAGERPRRRLGLRGRRGRPDST